jgi:subtilisin family serine protease
VNEQYVIFEITSPMRDEGDFGLESLGVGDNPPEATVHAVELSEAEAADERRKPTQILAPELPTMLIEPVSMAEAAAPAAAGASWGVEAVGATQSPFTGSGITVAVLDTGVDSSHEAFQGVNVARQDFTGEGDEDEHGHGTHCAGTIAGRDIAGFRFGVATGVTALLAGKVLGNEGGSTDALVNGIHWAVDNGANVISMSLGIDFPGAVEQMTQRGLPIQPATSRALEAYRDNLRLFGAIADFVQARAAFDGTTIIVAATGNESERERPENPYTVGVAPPAASEGFIAVGAVGKAADGGFGIASFSNAGATVVAPGVDIRSARAGGGFADASGTSMATPHVAGVAALWAEKIQVEDGQIDVEVLRARLTGSGQRLSALGSGDVGTGLVMAPAA